MRIVVELSDGQTFTAEPTLLDFRDAGEDLRARLDAGGFDSIIAAAEVAWQTLTRAEQYSEPLDVFLGLLVPEGISLKDGEELDPTTGA